MFNRSFRRRYIEKELSLVAQKRAKSKLIKKKNLINELEKDNDLSKMTDAHKINDDMQWDCEDAVSFDDNEYSNYDGNPSVLITTSNDPSSGLKKFAKEIRHLIPNSERMNRGNVTMTDLYDRCVTLKKTDLIILSEVRGVPTSIVISHMPYGPTVEMVIQKVETRHQMDLTTEANGKKKMPSENPGFVISGLDSVLGNRLRDVFMKLFPVTKRDTNHIIYIMEEMDIIVLKNLTIKTVRKKITNIEDHGPSLQMFLKRIYNGTILEQKTAKSEYEYRPFMNTAGTKFYLSKPKVDDAEMNEDDSEDES